MLGSQIKSSVPIVKLHFHFHTANVKFVFVIWHFAFLLFFPELITFVHVLTFYLTLNSCQYLQNLKKLFQYRSLGELGL